MHYYTYVLRSVSHGNRYVGSTQNIKNRLKEHNSGKCEYTKGRKPWQLLYFEEFSTRSEAMKRERFLKSGQGRKYLDSLVN